MAVVDNGTDEVGPRGPDCTLPFPGQEFITPSVPLIELPGGCVNGTSNEPGERKRR